MFMRNKGSFHFRLGGREFAERETLFLSKKIGKRAREKKDVGSWKISITAARKVWMVSELRLASVLL